VTRSIRRPDSLLAPSVPALLVRERDLGQHDDPGPRDLPAPDRLLRWARPVLLPLSSVMRVQTDRRVLALTYDDGPHPERTAGVLAELARRGVRATFFVLTDRAEEQPQMIREMLAAGHEIGLHGIDHTRLTEVFWPAAVRRIWVGKRRLERISGSPVTMYRPTYGAQGLAQFLAARLLGMDVVYWTAWARDWTDDEASAVAERAIGARHPGAVLLLHDTTEDTPVDIHVGDPVDAPRRPTFSRAEVIGRILSALEQDSYQVVPVGELLRTGRVVRAVTTQRPWVTLTVSLRRRAGRLLRHATPS
jgi:peptidoglycan/xylan/chitin deacetylase (PgdA/CDA1 family)